MAAPLGYEDTPILPNTTWKVHDPNRPYPGVVTPGPLNSEEIVNHPPSDATVLFDGPIFRTGSGAMVRSAGILWTE